jgi:catechol 2,3-dioxygenase-like lactoylglutathione lyase family enzyme
MGLTVGMVTIDCTDPQQLARFWSAALGVEVQADYGDYVFLQRPADGGPMLGLQRVPEPRAGKNRVHVDLRGESRATGVPRLVGLGATVLGEHEVPGLRWTVLTDPEGNEFCLGERTG